MNNPDQTRHSDAGLLMSEQAGDVVADVDQHVQRIRRMGKRLFRVANCVIAFRNMTEQWPDTGRAMTPVEADFCYKTRGEITVVNDAREHPEFAKHGAVTGAPHIRFFASHPVHDAQYNVIGSVNLVDHVPRAFNDEDRLLLADLATMVERELHLRSMSASQLDLQKKNKNLRRKSLIDPLLGTWNRGAIMRILTIEAVRCDKLGIPLSLVVADLDFFKKINDTYGHPAGDTVLVKIASRLRSCIRPQEALGRYGGEEFLIVLPGASHSTAMAVAERMRVAIASQPETIGDSTVFLTISAGVASTELFPSATTDELISHADVALYAAKDAGRNLVAPARP